MTLRSCYQSVKTMGLEGLGVVFLCLGLILAIVCDPQHDVGVDKPENGHNLTSLTKEMFSSSQSLRKTIEVFLTEMAEVENTNLLLGRKGDIKYDLLAESSQDYTIHPFGSRVMGLGLRTSDCDLFVDVGGCYRGDHPAESKCLNAVRTISDSLYRHNHSFYDMKLIPKTKVPLLKVVHRNTGLQVDISTRNGIGVENSRLIRGYFADRRVRFVAAAVKMWARDQGLAKTVVGPGAFSSYCMVWLVLFALMQDDPPAVSPNVDLKRKYTGPKLVVDGWDCGHCRSTHPKLNNNKTEIQLLHHFFNFYSNMTLEDIKSNVICPHTGQLIPKAQFTDTLGLPSEFDNYKQQVVFNRSSYLMVCDSPLCLQDPVEQSNNIAKAVEDWAITRFLNSCQTSAKLMENMFQFEFRWRL